ISTWAVIGMTCTALAILSVTAQRGGMNHYFLHLYPPVVVLYAILIACLCEAAARLGDGTGVWAGVLSVLLSILLDRPAHADWDVNLVAMMWRDSSGAVCSYRFGEGFVRAEESEITVPSDAVLQHAIDQCRLLSERSQILDCIGGVTYPWLRILDVHPERA